MSTYGGYTPALALGLASLSSNRTQVESLFIDEGFGTLDPETLDIDIASLDTLQALGRKVCVISHVPILVERFGARVVVEKLGGGRSSVVIVGGYQDGIYQASHIGWIRMHGCRR